MGGVWGMTENLHRQTLESKFSLAAVVMFAHVGMLLLSSTKSLAYVPVVY